MSVLMLRGLGLENPLISLKNALLSGLAFETVGSRNPSRLSPDLIFLFDSKLGCNKLLQKIYHVNASNKVLVLVLPKYATNTDTAQRSLI